MVVWVRRGYKRVVARVLPYLVSGSFLEGSIVQQSGSVCAGQWILYLGACGRTKDRVISRELSSIERRARKVACFRTETDVGKGLT